MAKSKVKLSKAKSTAKSVQRSKFKKKIFKKKHKWAKPKQNDNDTDNNQPSFKDATNAPQSSRSTQAQDELVSKKTMKKLTGKKNKTLESAESLSLRDKMLKQLNAARFRQINETLDSGNADPRDAFEDDYNVYAKYHETYKELRKTWDINPLNNIIEIIQKIENKNQHKGSLQVVDFGCGDGNLENSFEKTNIKVHGLDLYKLHPNTIVCDMKSVPFQNNSVDIAVFCLSLMAKDIGQFVAEANRILKPKGTLIIGEVESRFHGGAKKFTLNMKSYGFVTSKKETEKKGDKFNAHLTHTRLGDMFIIMEFAKVKNLNLKDKKLRLPPLAMKPCVYKKR